MYSEKTQKQKKNPGIYLWLIASRNASQNKTTSIAPNAIVGEGDCSLASSKAGAGEAAPLNSWANWLECRKPSPMQYVIPGYVHTYQVYLILVKYWNFFVHISSYVRRSHMVDRGAPSGHSSSRRGLGSIRAMCRTRRACGA